MVQVHILPTGQELTFLTACLTVAQENATDCEKVLSQLKTEKETTQTALDAEENAEVEDDDEFEANCKNIEKLQDSLDENVTKVNETETRLSSTKLHAIGIRCMIRETELAHPSAIPPRLLLEGVFARNTQHMSTNTVKEIRNLMQLKDEFFAAEALRSSTEEEIPQPQTYEISDSLVEFLEHCCLNLQGVSINIIL